MTTSEQVNEIAAALAKAQSGMKNAALNKVNPHFRSKYADLAGIRDAVIPTLTANCIAVVQTLDVTVEGGNYLRTRLMHSSGQWIESLCPIPPAPDMQKMGSAITYARRYSLSAICGIAADEDDDGNEAAKPTNGTATVQPESRPIPGSAPAGYQKFVAALMVAAEKGMPALTKAFNDGEAVLRTHLTRNDNGTWEAMKANATKRREAVPA
jgi:hypothetical protein